MSLTVTLGIVFMRQLAHPPPTKKVNDMNSEEIRIARKALYDKGNIKLVQVSRTRGKMAAINHDGYEDAEEYNRLATLHFEMHNRNKRK